MVGLFLGSFVFVIILAPIQALAFLLVRLAKAPSQLGQVILWLPTLTITVLAPLQTTHGDKRPNEPEIFHSVTGMPYPKGATLLKAGHGFGFQDKRHLWVFAGAPEGFNAIQTSANWREVQDGLQDVPIDERNLKQVDQVLSHDRPWSVASTYFWMADKDVETGPSGPGWLVVDKEHRRWFVWWEGI